MKEFEFVCSHIPQCTTYSEYRNNCRVPEMSKTAFIVFTLNTSVILSRTTAMCPSIPYHGEWLRERVWPNDNGIYGLLPELLITLKPEVSVIYANPPPDICTYQRGVSDLSLCTNNTMIKSGGPRNLGRDCVRKKWSPMSYQGFFQFPTPRNDVGVRTNFSNYYSNY